jgi:hypothetical protein
MTRDDHKDCNPELAELALKLRELERDQEEEEGSLFPESFMQEFTDFKTWDEFKVRLVSTPVEIRRSSPVRSRRQPFKR